MSMSISEKEYVYVERFRPKLIDDIILPDFIKKDIKKWIEDGQIPNLLFSSKTPGLGKSSLAHTIIHELNAEALFINASLESNIDILRSKILGFVSTVSFDGRPKIVVLDEADYLNCLEEHEKIQMQDGSTLMLKDMKEDTEYAVKSFNMDNGEFEDDTASIINSKTDDVYEIELDNGLKIQVNDTHPFIVQDVNGNIFTRTIKEGFNDVEIILK